MKIFIGKEVDGHLVLAVDGSTWQKVDYPDGSENYEFKGTPHLMLTGTEGCCGDFGISNFDEICGNMKPGDMREFEIKHPLK